MNKVEEILSQQRILHEQLNKYLSRPADRPAVHSPADVYPLVLPMSDLDHEELWVIGLNVRKVDLVWGTSPPIFHGLTASGLGRLKRVPFLFEVRDLWPAFAIAVGVLRQPLLIRLSEWLESFLYRHADQLVVNSPGFIKHVQARGGQNIELIPN